MLRRSLWVVAIAMVLAVKGPTLLSYMGSNAGFLILNRAMASEQSSDLDQMQTLFTKVIRLDQRNSAGFRGLGFVNLALQQTAAAQLALSNGGMTQDDMVFFADKANRNDELTVAKDWLAAAELMDANEPALWQVTGKVCQKVSDLDEFCLRFLERNEQNWIVNNSFNLAKDGWHTREVSGFDLDYDVVPCPDGRAGLCAVMGADDDLPEHGLSWSQCVRLEVGRTYRFSAWIKADVAKSSLWRPVYIQGAIDGVANGIWPGDEIGPAPWTYWQQLFTMPEFDGDQVCFYPARLMGQGQIWFSQPSLTMLEEQ